VSFDPCRLPYPGGPDGRDCCSSIRDAFALMGGARRPRYSHSNRFMWGDSRGCRVRVMLRPGSLVALHRQGRLLELSPHRVAPMDRRAFLRGQQSIAAAGLAPADTQPYRLRERRGAPMGRPMPSAVSALWGCVANGHQAVHHVSSSPSKIPYGGFSPVRLQAGRRRQPSPARGLICRPSFFGARSQ